MASLKRDTTAGTEKFSAAPSRYKGFWRGTKFRRGGGIGTTRLRGRNQENSRL